MNARPEIWDALQHLRASGVEPREAAIQLAERRSELLQAPRGWRADSLVKLREIWGDALDRCELLIDGCQEAVGLFTRHYSERARAENESRFDVTRDLWERAYDAAWEAHVLLSHGAPGGALARWRTVRELNVVSAFIGNGNAELARRYREWQGIEAKHSITDWGRAIEGLGVSVDASSLEQDQAALKERYGGLVTREFGWADERLREQGINTKGKPSLWHLERAVGGVERRASYRMASQAVHASLFSGAVTPDRGVRVPNRLGPKPAGLRDPARFVCSDLWMTAGNFMSLYEDDGFAWAQAVLSFLIVDATAALEHAEQQARQRWSE
jgi:hypothetical protein